MATNAYASTIAGNCGASFLSNINPGAGSRDGLYRTVGTYNPGGIGLMVTGFVDTPECRDAYTTLSKKWKLVYQSEVRRNANSGRNFFLCVFDSGKKIPFPIRRRGI